MGLREVKIERTRAQIVEVAHDLFLEQGYSATTMEQVAEAAEVGTSTLYRYFPSKELLVLDPFVRAFDFAALLAARPEGEPVEVSLGQLIRQAFPQGDLDHDRFVTLRRIVLQEPGVRSRLWDVVDQATDELERWLAERLGCPVEDLRVVMAASTVLVVHDLVSHRWSGRTHRSWEQTVDRILEALPGVDPLLPR